MRGQKRLEEIKRGLKRTLQGMNLEKGRYDIRYEPLVEYVSDEKGRKVPIVHRLPAYQFVLVDKKNDADYIVRQVLWCDIAKPMNNSDKKYTYGPAVVPDLQKGIDALRQYGGKTKRKEKSSGLERGVATTVIIGLLGGLFFLSSNITGNAISSLNQTSSNWTGAVLLVIGLIAGFFWMKNK